MVRRTISTTPTNMRAWARLRTMVDLAIVLASQSAETIHAAKGCEDKTETVYSLSLSDGGRPSLASHGIISAQTTMPNAGSFPNCRLRNAGDIYQEIVSGVTQGAQPTGDFTTQFDTYPGRGTILCPIDNYASWTANSVLRSALYALVPAGRKPITVRCRFSSQRHSENTVRTEIELPSNYKQIVISPSGSELTVPEGGGVARTVQKTRPASLFDA